MPPSASRWLHPSTTIGTFVLAVVIAGCGGATATISPAGPSPSAPIGLASTPPTAAPTAAATPTAIPSPTPIPTPDIAVAAKATLAAFTAYNKAGEAAFKKYGCKTLPACKRWAAAAVKIEQKLIATIQAIEYPADIKADVKNMLRWDSEVMVTYRTMATAKTWADWNRIARQFDAADLKAAAAAALMRTDLGLPPLK